MKQIAVKIKTPVISQETVMRVIAANFQNLEATSKTNKSELFAAQLATIGALSAILALGFIDPTDYNKFIDLVQTYNGEGLKS